MISALILSKDRPCQLHLLLESIQRNTSNLFDITVVYEADGEEMEKGYDFTKRYFHFKDKLGHTFPIKWKIIQNPYGPDGYFIDKPQEGDFLYDKYMVWDPTKIEPYTNFAIPFSINGHIYNTSFLSRSILGVKIKDFQDFETLMQKGLYNGSIKNVPRLMASLEYSTVIHNSNKKVSDDQRSGLGISLEDINERYLAGMMIDYEHFDFTHVSKPFQDFILKFKHEDYMHYSYTGSQAG